MKGLLITLFTLSALVVSGQETLIGKWAGEVIYSQDKIPFEFEINNSDGKTQLILINGSERIVQDNLTINGDSLTVRLSPFDVELQAKFSTSKMNGLWVKHYRRSSGVRFQATKNGRRFEPAKNKPSSIPKEFSINLQSANGAPYNGLVMIKQEGSQLEGTIITGTGDLRYFSGIMDGDSLKMSSFDGAHGFLFKGVEQGENWSGELVFDNNYNEIWVQVESDFGLKPAFESLEDVDEVKSQPFFDILAAGEGHSKFEKSDFEGKVSVIQLLGSWCPNSLDETKYLSKWFKENNELDIQVLAVFYEINYSPEYAKRRIEDYVKDNSIEYQTAIGGRANKGQAALAFPFMNKIDAFPTMVILDKSGKARYVHNYFEGPATGDRYKKFDDRFKEIIDELLSEEL